MDGFTLTSNIPIITPAYSEMIVTMNVSIADYLELDIYVGDSSKANWYDGDLRTIRLVDSSINVDIQGIIQPFFKSDASGIIELKRIDLKGHYFKNSVDTSLYLDKYYVFNGVNNGFRVYDYIFDGSVNAKFLNNWETDINIHENDKNINLYFFNGIFENSTGRYDVSTASFEIKYNGKIKNYKTTENTYPRIYKLNVDPSNLNSLVADLSINYSTNPTYTVDPSLNSTDIYKKTINIIPINHKGYTPKRVSWVDTMGCINTFNFDLVKENEIDITKQTYWNNGDIKIFNTEVKDRYALTSDWISENESIYLKDLWHSPSVIVDTEYVNILTTKQEIKKKRTDRLINYVLEYELTKEYKTQKN